MRDPDRIPLILAAVERAWRKDPDQRLGQLLANAVRNSGTNVSNVEDGALIRLLGTHLTDEEQRYAQEEPIKSRAAWEDFVDHAGPVARRLVEELRKRTEG